MTILYAALGFFEGSAIVVCLITGFTEFHAKWWAFSVGIGLAISWFAFLFTHKL